MQIQLSSYTKNTEQECKFCSITTIQPKFQFFVKSQIQNLICTTELEKNQSIKQDFFGNYSRFIRTNTKFNLQCTNQHPAENLNQFYQDYHKLIQSSSRVKTAEHNQLYWFTLPQGLRSVFFAPQAKKISLSLVNCLHQTITQFLLPVRIKHPLK